MRKHLKTVGTIILIVSVPFTLILINRVQNYRSSASTPDNLEAENGILSSTGVTKQTDSGASGGSYVLFNKQIASPTPTPVSLDNAVYGSGLAVTTLANTKIGGNGAMRTSMRFKSEQSSFMNSFKLYWLTPNNAPSGYAQGTGGIIKFTLEADNNGIPSGNSLSTKIVNIAQEVGGNTFATISFSTPPMLTKGEFYHLVAANIDPDPISNNMSLDYIWNSNYANENISPHPKYPDGNYSHLMNYSLSGGTWQIRAAYLSIIDITFSNGSQQGMGYMETSYSSYDQIGKINGSNLVREKIIVSGENKYVTGVGIKTHRGNGSSPLIIKIKQGSNTLAQVQISSSEAPLGPADPLNSSGRFDKEGGYAIWIEKSLLSPITLQNGLTYSLELSTASDTTYYIWTNRSGVGSYNFSLNSVFSDGGAEYSSNNGTSWGVLGRVKATSPNQNNLQAFLRLSN